MFEPAPEVLAAPLQPPGKGLRCRADEKADQQEYERKANRDVQYRGVEHGSSRERSDLVVRLQSGGNLISSNRELPAWRNSTDDPLTLVPQPQRRSGYELMARLRSPAKVELARV